MQTVLQQHCSVLLFWTLIIAIIVIAVTTVTTELLELKLLIIKRLCIPQFSDYMESCNQSSLHFNFFQPVVYQNATLRNRKKMLNSVQTLGSRSQSKVYEVNKVSSQTLQTVIQNLRTSRDKLLPTIWYRVMFQFRLESQKLKPHFKYILSTRWSEQMIFGPQCVTDLRTILSSMKSLITCIPLFYFPLSLTWVWTTIWFPSYKS